MENEKIDPRVKAIGDRIVILRDRKSQDDYSLELGIHKNTLRNYEAGKRIPDALTVLKICEVSGATPEWLMTGTGPKKTEERDDLADKMERTKRYSGEEGMNEEYVLVPKHNLNGYADDETPKKVAFRKDWIVEEMRLIPEKLSVITVVGDSMEPTLRHGDLLLLDLTQSQVSDDAIYAVRFRELLLIKRLQVMPDGSILVHSDNRSYADHTVHSEEVSTLNIIARVVWMGRRI